jgi:hypothetical protein
MPRLPSLLPLRPSQLNILGFTNLLSSLSSTLINECTSDTRACQCFTQGVETAVQSAALLDNPDTLSPPFFTQLVSQAFIGLDGEAPLGCNDPSTFLYRRFRPLCIPQGLLREYLSLTAVRLISDRNEKILGPLLCSDTHLINLCGICGEPDSGCLSCEVVS